MAATRLLYLITDRSALGPGALGVDRLVRMIHDAAASGVDLVQIRERDLAAHELVTVCQRAREAVEGTRLRLLVNDRFDVALASGIDGVHLTTRSIPTRVVRAVCGDGFLVGQSTHSAEEVAGAEAGGASFVVCGPVFDTPSKRSLGAPLGPAVVSGIASTARIPVLALGGVSRETAAEACGAGVAGIAAIRLFQDAWLEGGAASLATLVSDLREAI